MPNRQSAQEWLEIAGHVPAEHDLAAAGLLYDSEHDPSVLHNKNDNCRLV